MHSTFNVKQVYKESGAPRIYTYTNRVLFVDGIPEWNIFIADLPSAGATEFILRHQLELPRVNRNLVDPFFASDQTGSSVALAFFVVENSFSEASSAILLCDILTGGYRVVSPWEVSPLLGKFDVSAGIEEMRSAYSARCVVLCRSRSLLLLEQVLHHDSHGEDLLTAGAD